MKMYSGLSGFSFINENSGVFHLDATSLNNASYIALLGALAEKGMSFHTIRPNVIQISSGGSMDDIQDVLNRSAEFKNINVESVSSRKFDAQLIYEMNLNNNTDVSFQNLMSQYFIDVNEKVKNTNSSIESLKKKFNPYELNDVKGRVMKNTGYIKNIKDKLDEGSKKRAKLSKFIDALKMNVSELERINIKETEELNAILSQKLAEISGKIDRMIGEKSANKNRQELTGLLTQFRSIRDAKPTNDKEVLAVEQKLEGIRDQLGMSDSDSIVDDAAVSAIAYMIDTYTHTLQKSKDDITKQHMAIVAQLATIKESNPEDFKRMTEGLNETTKTKLAIYMNTKEEKQTDKQKDKHEDMSKGVEGTTTMDFGKEGHKTSNRYVHTIHLPIDKLVVIKDLESIRVKEGEKEKKWDDELDSAFAKISRGLHNVLGYDVENEAARTVAKYSQFRDATSSLVRWLFANPVALLTGVAGGAIGAVAGKSKEGFVKGGDIAQGVGDFVKFEMIRKPEELNPALVEFEKWLRNKMHLGINIKEGMEAGGVSTPNGSSGFGNMPGTTFQTGLTIGGMGNPLAPTKDSVGSGDNFNPPKRKKKKGPYKKQRYEPFQIADFTTYFNGIKKSNK